MARNSQRRRRHLQPQKEGLRLDTAGHSNGTQPGEGLTLTVRRRASATVPRDSDGSDETQSAENAHDKGSSLPVSRLNLSTFPAYVHLIGFRNPPAYRITLGRYRPPHFG